MFLKLMYSKYFHKSGWSGCLAYNFLTVYFRELQRLMEKMIFPEIKTKLLYPQCFSPPHPLPQERCEVKAELPVLSLKTSSIPDFQTKKFLLPLV